MEDQVRLNTRGVVAGLLERTLQGTLVLTSTNQEPSHKKVCCPNNNERSSGAQAIHSQSIHLQQVRETSGTGRWAVVCISEAETI